MVMPPQVEGVLVQAAAVAETIRLLHTMGAEVELSAFLLLRGIL
jgi:hypothetical protein